MAITHYFVNPSVLSDGGLGTKASPWTRANGDPLNYAFTQITQGPDGDQINVKSDASAVQTDPTTDNVLTAELTPFASGYGIPALEQPLIIRGYKTDENDGYRGGIDGDALYSIIVQSGQDWTSFIDMHLHNTGSNQIMHLDAHCHLIRCHVGESSFSGTASVDLAGSSFALGCTFYDMAGSISLSGTDCMIAWCGFIEGPNNFIGASNRPAFYRPKNIRDTAIWLNHTGSRGLQCNALRSLMNLSVFNNAAGTAQGIGFEQYNLEFGAMNCAIEGFNGTGGRAIHLSSGSQQAMLTGNTYRNCTTGLNDAGADHIIDDWNQAAYIELAGASPFTNGAIRDLSPFDTGSMKEGSVPQEIGDGDF